MLRKEDWMYIKAQVEKGVCQKDIARELGVHPKTISRALKRGGPASGRRLGGRKSKLDRHIKGTSLSSQRVMRCDMWYETKITPQKEVPYGTIRWHGSSFKEYLRGDLREGIEQKGLW